MKRIHKITLLLFSALLIVACSRKKSTFLSRNFHAVTAEYNALYNGGVAMDAGKLELANSYRDNFWEILPVERVKIEDEILAPGQAGNPNFEKAEEKAAKAIQKHSIFVDGKEYNPQIDEAYMLLGRARYMEGRFLPALDAFNYILYRYPTSNNINFAKVWKAKANIRLENEEIALKDLDEMLEKGDLDDKELADATAIMAQAYINLDSIEEAIPYIKLASEYEKNNELRGRYAYIKGQLYNRVDEKDSANLAFDEVIALNRKSPRIYMINAYIEKANNFDYENGDRTAFLELLRELEENRENRPYLDKIYNQIGEYYRNTKDIDSAVMFYNKSIQSYNQDRFLQAKNYSTLAEINFDAAYYQAAGAYYDSTLTFLEEISRDYRRFKKKRENLEDVIKYEDIAMRHDSIIELTTLSEAEQLAYFKNHTEKLKEQAVKDSIAAAEAKENMANGTFSGSGNNTTSGGPKAQGGQFYFYNQQIAAYGKQEFRKIWGNRELRDYWRLSSIQTSNIPEEEEVEMVAISDNEMFDPQTYIAQIPTDQKVIDSLIKDRDFAYYQLGLIYKEKFREYDLATDRLERLLTFNPEDRLLLPAKYNLYKIYTVQGDTENAEKWRNNIITNHSESRYAEILKNPNKALELDESSPEYKYNQLYKEFENSRYEYVIETADDYINQYTGTDIVPKLEMLKATAIGRQQGYNAYKEALNYVSLNYPTTEEGKEAQKMYSTVLPKLASSAFVAPNEDTKWKVVYQFTSEEREKAEELKVKLDDAVTNYRYNNMSTSIDYYDPNTVFVILHGFNTDQGGKSFAQLLSENKDYKIKKESFTISSPNYKIVQIHKNLNDYLSTDPLPEENKEDDPQK